MSDDVGVALARAVAAKDHEALRAVLTPDVDFRALTPGRAWEAGSPDGVVEVLFGSWFPVEDEITALLSVHPGDPVEDTQHVTYRLALRTPDGDRTAEQHAYYRAPDGRIGYLRMMCSGFRPSAPRAPAEAGPPTP